MAIKVQCACGKAFAAKDELAGKTVKCPSCQQPLKIPAGSSAAAPAAKPAPAKPATAKPAAPQPAAKAAAKPAGQAKPAAAPAAGQSAHDLFDEIGLQAAAEGTQPCPGCTEPMPIAAVVCIKCGYNTRLGRRMETVKIGGASGGPEGHGAVAQDLMDRAAQVIEDDAAEEVKKTSEGMPWWVFLIVLVLLICLAAGMLMFWVKEEPKDEKKGFLRPTTSPATAVVWLGKRPSDGTIETNDRRLG
jgi:hypothetical protein